MVPLIRQEKGNILVLAAAFMTVMLLVAATSIDVSYMLTARNQLQSAVDASALAGASGLTVSQSTARNRAISISGVNTILNQPVALQSSEISFPNYKTIRVTAQRPVPAFFARLANMNTFNIRATATAQCGNRDIMLVFDRSGTMDDDTVDPLRPEPITTAQEAADYFVDEIANNSLVVDRIGLVSYSDNAALESALDRAFANKKNKIDSYAANGYTNIGDGIRQAVNHLGSQSLAKTKKTIILFSDGMANRPGSGMPTNQTAINYALSWATQAKNREIRVYTISLGTETDPALMQQIASRTGGKYYYAPSASDLYAIFSEIAQRIPGILIE